MNHYKIIKNTFKYHRNTNLRYTNKPYNKTIIQHLSNHIITKYFKEINDDSDTNTYIPINTDFRLSDKFVKKFIKYFHNLPLTYHLCFDILGTINTNLQPNLFNIKLTTEKDLKIILGESNDIITPKLFKQLYKHFGPNHDYTCDPEVDYKITKFLYYNDHHRQSILNIDKFILSITILPKKISFLFDTFGYKYVHKTFPKTHSQFSTRIDYFLAALFHTRCSHYENTHYMFKRDYLDIKLYYNSTKKVFTDFYKNAYPKCYKDKYIDDKPLEKDHPNYDEYMYNISVIRRIEESNTRNIERDFNQYKEMYDSLYNSCMRLKININKKLNYKPFSQI